MASPAALRDFVSVGLQHHHVISDEEAAFLSPAQATLWAALLVIDPVPEVDRVLNPMAQQTLRDLDARKSAQDALKAAEKRATRLAGHAKSLEAALAKAQAFLTEREDTLAANQAALADDNKTLTETVETLVSLEKLMIGQAEEDR